ncbi:MAG: hypothetical protein K9K32_07065 [Halanaerobiales bacterium]|nr:hypothetical protein [Halanaerobiales bacterium]
MLSAKLENEMDKLGSALISEIENVSTNFTEFGYRERIRIERYLFLLIKAFCQKELGYNLQGFSKWHIEEIISLSSEKQKRSLNLIVDQAFQLKIYLQSLSSENAYVRGDALTKLGLDRKRVFPFIQSQSKSIVNKINMSSVEPGV